MALRLRRGTDAERAAITFEEGELVYTTDTKEVFVGDGATPGGVNLVANASTVSPNSITIEELAVNDGTAGQVLSTDGSGNLQFITVTAGTGSFTGDVIGSVFSDDSTVIIDGQNRLLNVDSAFVLTSLDVSDIICNTITGNLTGNVEGNVEGNVIGSLFADDSRLIIDGINNLISTDTIQPTNSLTIETPLLETVMNIVSEDDNSSLKLLRTSNSDISSSSLQYGRISFGRSDTVGEVVETVFISGFQDGLAISHDFAGAHTSPSTNLYIVDGQFAFGTFAPAANSKVDVAGNLHVTGGYTQFGSLTTAERDALSPANGMVIYNTTNNKFEGYQNGGWINLDDGLAAS